MWHTQVRFTCMGKMNYCYHIDPCINCINFFLIVRSTPCPHVKHGDEWGEPTNCDSGDNCPYCHTRTEQQFHPEVGNVSLQYHKPIHVTYTQSTLSIEDGIGTSIECPR